MPSPERDATTPRRKPRRSEEASTDDPTPPRPSRSPSERFSDEPRAKDRTKGRGKDRGKDRTKDRTKDRIKDHDQRKCESTSRPSRRHRTNRPVPSIIEVADPPADADVKVIVMPTKTRGRRAKRAAQQMIITKVA